MNGPVNILHLLGRLPLWHHRLWGRVLGFLMGPVLGYRKAVVMENLTNSFPDKSPREIRAVARAFYRHLATIFTEMLWFGACRGEKGRERLHRSHIVEITNPEVLNRLYEGAGQLMILQAHTGNWELIGGIRNYSYGPPLSITPEAFAVSYLRVRSPFWNEVMAQNRTAPVADLGFTGYVEAGDILRYVLKHKGIPYGYSFITDQHPYNRLQHLSVDFMHQKTLTMTSAAALAVKLDMAVVFLRYRCRPGGGYTMTFVPLSEHAGGDNPEDLMREYYRLLEEDLNAQPWNYLWSHKRWKK